MLPSTSQLRGLEVLNSRNTCAHPNEVQLNFTEKPLARTQAGEAGSKWLWKHHLAMLIMC